ncbi:MAG: hypothetical protein A2977_03910 [Alphaproteobacteria bacterium RIFCSPLOWO2_01_FULL_45_8]|nr:MAG: hypothetical protein A2621_04810 [Alphaproteobacteria bacterium RIFCSPHIGHO2_01_FULL_41_14]OFW95662.1 MAG: hypothetical protein A2977_03910 [Alphaproteobacteria bacterium RIFCSPLOWO2_01_FULL_45_8]
MDASIDELTSPVEEPIAAPVEEMAAPVEEMTPPVEEPIAAPVEEIATPSEDIPSEEGVPNPSQQDPLLESIADIEAPIENMPIPSPTPETETSQDQLNPLSETQEQISKADTVLNKETVTLVTEKTPAQAIVPDSDAVSAASEEVEAAKTDQDFLTLKDAMEGAYAQSPLLTAEYEVKAAQMALSSAKRTGWLPTASANVGYTTQGGDTVNSRSVLSSGARSDTQNNFRTDTTQGGLTLQQNLYSGGSTTANILAQEKTVDATLAAYIVTLRDTLLSAIQSFIALSSKQEVFRLRKSNQALLERQLEVAQNRYEFGELTRYDVAATQAKLDKAKAEVISALAEVEIAKANFVKITGITIEKSLKKPTDPSELLPASKAEAVQIALKLSPEIHKQEAIADAAKADIDKTFGGLLPSFDVSAGVSRTLTENWNSASYFQGYGGSRQNQAQAAATLTIPLDFRASTQSNVRQQKYVAAQKRLTAIYGRRSVIELVSKYWDSLEAARAQITQLKSQINAAQIAVETSTEMFLAGDKTTLEVLTAEQELLTAQVELVNAEQAVILNAYQILATIGRLDAQTLELNVDIYKAKEEYDQMSFWGVGIGAADKRIAAQEFSTDLMKEAEATQ